MQDEIRRLVRLAAPLIAGHVGNQLMSFVDTAMVGRLGASPLAGVGIANGLFFSITLLGMGIVIGMDAPTSQAWGARDPVLARRLLWNGIHVALLASVPISLLVALSPAILDVAGVDREIAQVARDYLWGRIPNVLPFLLFTAARSYLQAVGVTRPLVVATVLGNIANAVGNALLIFGDDALERIRLPRIGLPAYGALGSAISSSIASALMAGVLFFAVARFEAPPDPERRRLDPALVRTIARLGGPFGLQLLAEVGVFALVAMLTGRPEIGAASSSGHQIAITLASFTFTITIGIASATSVLVGHAIGRGDTPAARRAGFAGFVAAAGVMSVSLVGFMAVPALLARILTNDPTVVAAAIPLIRIAAVFQLSDGTQATGAGALRGAGDARFPLWANIVGHYLVGLPIAIFLGFPMKMGAVGLWWGLSAGLTAVAIGLLARFIVLTRGEIERV